MALNERQRAEPGESRLRLQTAVRLRWFGVVGQLLTVCFVYLGLGFTLPFGICVGFIALSAWLNVFLRIRYPARTRLSSALATSLLAYDILQLSALLYLTGGIENPFTFLLVAPVTVSAATLPPRNTIALGLLGAGATIFLVFYHLPLPWAPGSRPELLPIYKVGLLASVLSGMIFLALYAWRLAKEARQMADALTATELVLAREQQLHALDGLAAAAAHELGSPLSTITVVAKELAREAPKGGHLADDLALLQSQAARCKEILKKLTGGPTEPDPLHARMSVTQLIEESAEPYRGFSINLVVTASAEPGSEGKAADRARGRAPAGRDVRPRQPRRERRRLRARARRDRRQVVRQGDHHHHYRRRPRRAARRHGRPGRALHHDAPLAAAGHHQGRRTLGPGAGFLHRQDAAGALRRHGRLGQSRLARARRRRQGELATRHLRGRATVRPSRNRGPVNPLRSEGKRLIG